MPMNCQEARLLLGADPGDVPAANALLLEAAE